jgi:hypothetical protein
VRILVQQTWDDNMLDKIKRQVGQLEKAARERMEPTSYTGTEGGVVPCNPKAGKKVVMGSLWVERKSSLLNLSSVSIG